MENMRQNTGLAIEFFATSADPRVCRYQSLIPLENPLA